METKTLFVIFGLGAVLFFGFGSTASADVTIPGMGSGAYDVPSVGGPGDSVDKAPVCDMRARPKITKVEPDPTKPGDKITIKGENFGTKRSEEHTSELQSRLHLVCRLLLEKKKKLSRTSAPRQLAACRNIV